MRRMQRYLLWMLAALLVLIALVLVLGWWQARPAVPDGFYASPDRVVATPGGLLRYEPFTREVPVGASAWRILYTSTRTDGSPTVASAIIMVSNRANHGPRPVIVWTHGTTGVVPGCAPSLLEHPFENVPALQGLLDHGWIYVATDYVGQGTAGPHPYLIGAGQARSALDAMRAMRQLDGLHSSDRVVVWGHSQGGNAALWTGILASTYAPEVSIAGVAAIAPASDLRGLVEAAHETPIGRIMSSFILRAYSETYADVVFDNYVPGVKRLLAQDMAGRCLAGRQALFSVLEALVSGRSIFAVPPISGALGERLAQNTPDRPLPQPVLIVQGLQDDLVLPDIQLQFVRARCSAGQHLEFRTYAGRDHLTVVAPDSPLTNDLLKWTQARITGESTPAGCAGL